MKTEKQIAEENIKEWGSCFKLDEFRKRICQSHKATCQRFLEFLEGLDDRILKRLKILSGFLTDEVITDLPKVEPLLLEKKITDLKQAIKLYEDAGI